MYSKICSIPTHLMQWSFRSFQLDRNCTTFCTAHLKLWHSFYAYFRCEVLPFVKKCLWYTSSIRFPILGLALSPYRVIPILNSLVHFRIRLTPSAVVKALVYKAIIWQDVKLSSSGQFSYANPVILYYNFSPSTSVSNSNKQAFSLLLEPQNAIALSSS